MLQVIKAKEVRDGEPRWYCRDTSGANAAIAANAVALFVPSDDTLAQLGQAVYPLAIVDRPAPTPTPAPGLDLDAVERAERAMTPGPWRHGSVERHHVFCSEGDRSLLCPEAGRVLLRMNEHFPHDSDAAGIVTLRNAATALIAEVRALRAAIAEVRDLIGSTEHESTCAIGPCNAEQNGADCSCTVGAISAALEAL